MTCGDARIAVLEADLQTLRGSGSDPLARHLRECRSCRSLAAAIVEGEGNLADALATAVPPPDLDRVLRLAAEAPEPAWTGPYTRPKVTWFHARVSVPLAIAAALALLFFTRTPSLPGPRYAPPPPSQALQVEALEGQTVAVLETSNPEISVVWLF